MPRTGYDPGFLRSRVEIPELDAAVRLDGSDVISYTHFSLALSRARRFAFWVAWNIDGAAMRKLPRIGIDFVEDPHLPARRDTGGKRTLPTESARPWAPGPARGAHRRPLDSTADISW
ncbi:DNA/RNA non-specific endonuclease [Nocardia fluminea]|uniref:DNA/RNA non-specific endonuclease n=1 Tax=Nocardia fluminea TaxID=134984 RepID=UPI003807866F